MVDLNPITFDLELHLWLKASISNNLRAVKSSKKLNVVDLQDGNALSWKWLTFSLK